MSVTRIRVTDIEEGLKTNSMSNRVSQSTLVLAAVLGIPLIDGSICGKHQRVNKSGKRIRNNVVFALSVLYTEIERV